MNPTPNELQGDPAPVVVEEAAPVYDLGVLHFPEPGVAAHTDYRVVNACISIRRLPDPECADEVQWVAGDIMGPGGLDYPDHLNTAALLDCGAITAL